MKKLMILLAAALCLISLNAFADNYGFLRDAPASFFTDEDYQILKANELKALNYTKDNAKLTWENPKTGASGYFIPYETTNKDGKICRKMKVYSQAAKRTGMSYYSYCKVNRHWVLQS